MNALRAIIISEIGTKVQGLNMIQIGSRGEQTPSFEALQKMSGPLQDGALSTSALNQLIQLVQSVAGLFLQKIKGMGCHTAQMGELVEQHRELVGSIKRCRDGVKSSQEAQGPYEYWSAKFGWSTPSDGEKELTLLLESVEETWQLYMGRCKSAADELFTASRVARALEVYKRLEQELPDDALLERIGDCYYQSGEEEIALRYYEKPRSQECHLKQVDCLTDLGRTKEAFELLRGLPQNNTVLVKGIESQLGMGKYLDAIYEALVAIEKNPKEDLFRDKLIDVYLSYSQRDDGELFRRNFPTLCKSFSQKSCYSALRKGAGDALQIIFDLLDYSARRSILTLTLFEDHISMTEVSEEFLEICFDNILCKIEFLEKKRDQISVDARKLRERLLADTFEDEDEVRELRSELFLMPQELSGGRKAEIRLGLISYNNFYKSLLLKLKEKVINMSEWRKKFEELEARVVRLQGEFSLCHKLFLREGEAEEGLRELFQRRYTTMRKGKPEVEEVSSVDWMKRGVLMDCISELFVPVTEREQVVQYLEIQGIDLEVLFRSGIMQMVPKVKSEMRVLFSFMKEKSIYSLADLKKGIDSGSFTAKIS